MQKYVLENMWSKNDWKTIGLYRVNALYRANRLRHCISCKCMWSNMNAK